MIRIKPFLALVICLGICHSIQASDNPRLKSLNQRHIARYHAAWRTNALAPQALRPAIVENSSKLKVCAVEEQIRAKSDPPIVTQATDHR